MSHSQIQAVGWILLTGFIAVSINTIVRYLSDDFHAFQLVFFYSFLALAFYMPSIWSGKLTVKTDRTKLYFLRSALEFVAFSLLFFGLTLMPLPVHTSLSFTSPLFGSIAAIIFLREPNSLHRWIALGIGFVGVLVITRPGVTDFDVSGLIVLAAGLRWVGSTLSGDFYFPMMLGAGGIWIVAFTLYVIALWPAISGPRQTA